MDKLRETLVKKPLEPTRDDLIELHKRMSRAGFNSGDALMAFVNVPDHALQQLWNDLHAARA